MKLKMIYLIPIGFATLLFLPMLNPGNQYFSDWVNSYWLGLTSRQAGFPNWFFGDIDNFVPLSPWFLYYGGYLYLFIGKIMAVFPGHELFIYRIIYLFSAVIYILSITLIGKMSGLKTFYAIAIGLFAISVPYYLANAYGRGALTEFVYISILPFTIACGFWFLKTKSQYIISGCLFCFGVASSLTTHTVSLLASALVFGIFVLLILLWALWYKKIKYGWNFLKAVKFRSLSIAFTSGVVLAFPQLLPSLLTSPQTHVALTEAGGVQGASLSSFVEVFRFWPQTPVDSSSPDLRTQTATGLLLVIVVLAIILLGKKIRTSEKTFILLSFVFIFCLGTLTTIPELMIALPNWVHAIQFPYRFISYLSFSILFASGIIFFQIQRQSHKIQRFAALSVFFVLTISLSGAVYQVFNTTNFDQQVDLNTVSASEAPPTWYAGSGAFTRPGNYSPGFVEDQEIIFVSSSKVVVDLTCDGREFTSIPSAAAPPLVKVIGATVIGTDKAGQPVIDTSTCDSGEKLHINVSQTTNSGMYFLFVIFSVISALVFLSIAFFMRWKENNRIQVESAAGQSLNL